ncbi:MAG TPA: DUF4349 domain-containing protein [Nocardiopsis listeri]|uniref:DUF4349 domain-containing protein n=1 Tax=Nocardiopsis listeri TaxID=53440 RepID=UPI001DC30F55|nr:DUF4349 domain-containing protein [Nocardiopsis listeri]HJE61196.1 DUF4349 domain-containing protein [Nocardiopsis listeri]
MTSAVLGALLLTSCGATSEQADFESAGSSAPESRDLTAPENADAEAPEGVEGAERGGEEAESADTVGSDVEIDDRRLIHTAHMTVRVQDVARSAEDAKELTRGLDGYVASEELSTPADGTPEGSLTLRIPNGEYEGALTDLAELGDRSDIERSVEDVTEEIADVESRIESSETALESLRGYLEEAENVDDLLRVEREIQDRQADLESFQARLETLQNQTSYSTVHLTLRPPSTYLEERSDDESIGFLGGLERGWRALLSLGEGLAVVVGWLLPFALVAAVIGAWPLWRLRRRRQENPKPEGRTGRRFGRRLGRVRPRRHQAVATTPTGTTSTVETAPEATEDTERSDDDSGSGDEGSDGRSGS